MTVSSTTAKNTYSGDGSTTAFAFSFRILDETHLFVQIKSSAGVITNQVLSTDYTVSGSGNDSGRTNYTSGNINFVTAPASTDTVIIVRSVPLKQETDYTENDTFPAETHEEALDELTMIAQQLDEELDRAIKVDSAIAGFNGTLPTPTADQYIKFDSAGTGLESFSLSATAGLGNVVEDTSPQLGGDLDANAFDIQFDDATGIRDDSDNEQLIFQKTASAVNHFEVTNAATGNSPLLKSVGDDANVDMRIAPQGSGTVRLEGTVVVPDEIQHDADTNNKIGFTTDTQTFTTGGSTRMDITDSGVRLGGANARVTTVLDEDTMSSNSATALATQQSIKAYVDSSSYVLLATATASSSASISFTGLSSAYFKYILVIDTLIPATDDSILYLRTDSNNGASFDSGASDYAYVGNLYFFNGSSVVTDAIGSSADSFIALSGNDSTSGVGNGATEGVSGTVTIINPSSSNYTTTIAHLAQVTADGEIGVLSATGQRLSAAAVDAVQLLYSSGNIASGVVKLYGVPSS